MTEGIRLRFFAEVNPPTPEFEALDDDELVTFLPLEAIWRRDDLDTSRTRPKTELSSGYTRFREGDILIPKITPTFQADRSTIALGLSDGVGAGTTELHVVRPGPTLDVRYANYLVSSQPFLLGGEAEMIGVAGQKRVPEGWLLDFKVPITDLARQRAVADFLDRETVRIDALIATKRQLIGMVGERFRSFLDQAFAHLDVNEVSLGRFVIAFTQGISPQAEDRPHEPGEWGMLKLSSVKFGQYIPSENKTLPPGHSIDPQLVPRRGDLLVTRSNTPSYVGDVCAIGEEDPKVVLCDLIYRVRLDGRMCPEFAAYAFLTSKSRWHLSSAARGTSQSMVKLRGEDVRATRIPLISTDEQEMIVRDLDGHRNRADAVVERLSRQIQLLLEHRQALITAAVMGELGTSAAA